MYFSNCASVTAADRTSLIGSKAVHPPFSSFSSNCANVRDGIERVQDDRSPRGVLYPPITPVIRPGHWTVDILNAHYMPVQFSEPKTHVFCHYQSWGVSLPCLVATMREQSRASSCHPTHPSHSHPHQLLFKVFGDFLRTKFLIVVSPFTLAGFLIPNPPPPSKGAKYALF